MKRFVKLLGHTLIHPADGFTDYKEKNCCPPAVGAAVAVLFFAARILQVQLTGFYFNYNRPERMNIGFLFVQTICVFVLWVACNWAVATLSDGKGTVRQIWFFSAVALFPYVLSILLNILLSNVLQPTESMFMTIVNAVGILWGLLILFAGMMTFHDYSLGEVIRSCLFTLALILVVVFICVLALSLFQQVFNFLDAVVREILYRL